MNKKFKLSLLSAIFSFSINTAYALNPPTAYTNTGNNTFIFFENNIDNEYFIASSALNPRFTGSNVWTRYGRSSERQDSLGYMGRDTGLRNNNFIDLWLENSDMRNPFQGLRCRTRNANECPSTGFVSPEFVDDIGAYKMIAGGNEYTGNAVRASFGPQAYEYLRSLSIGSVRNFDLHACETTENYNPALGQRCKDANAGRWRKFGINVTKNGHVQLFDTRAFSEIWVATDGTPSLSSNSEFCEQTVINAGGNALQREGIACRMLQYNLEGPMSNFANALRFYMVVDTAALGGVNLNEYDIRINGGNGDWKRFNQTGVDNAMNRMFQTGNGFVTVLFTRSFFQKMLAAGGSTSGRQGIFTFAVENTVTPQSGYYQFSSGVDIDIIPREYGISIRHQNQNERVKTGRIGEDEEDIRFDYIVTQSAPRRADVVQASVIGESNVNAGRSYCLFRSNDNAMSVRIPAYLSYTHSSGNVVEQYSGCDSNATLDMTNANWSAVPWDQQQSGYFYSTNLSLSFPMNDPASLFSVEGMDWLGSVRAEGDVRVEALWIGVDR